MDVRLPNGLIVRGVPDDYDQDDIRTLALDNKLATAKDFGEQSESVARIPKEGYQTAPAPGPGRSVEPLTPLDAALQGAAAVPAVGIAARGLQLGTAAGRAAPYTARLAESVIPKTGRALAFESAVGAGAGVAANEAAQKAPAGYEELYGLLAGGATSLGATAVPRGVQSVREISGLISTTKDIANQIGSLAGQGRASSQALTALNANPNLSSSILRALEIGDLTGVSLPMLAAGNGDTTISSFLQKQMAQGGNAKFTSSIKQQYQLAERQLAAAKKGVAPSMIEVDDYVRKQATAAKKQNDEIAKKALETTQRRQVGVENIDNRIRELSDQLHVQPGRTDIGTRLSNLVESKAASIRAELSPQYNEIIENARSSGIRLPESSAARLSEFATDRVNQDVFSSFPDLYSSIRRTFRPGREEDGFDLLDIDSLKRATNKAIRESKDPQETRRLLQLKREVDTAIDGLDPAFSQPYRALDAQYAERLGIPFSQAGVTKIDRSRFVEDTVPVLTSRSSSLKQALGVIGDSPEGIKIVEDAFLFDISSKRGIVNADGIVNPDQLRRYMKDHKEQIDMLPGLKQKLDGLTGRVDKLLENRASILLAEKQAKIDKVENLYTKAYGASGGIREVVRRALSNQQELDQLLKIAGKDKVAKEGIKSAMIDDILTIPGDRLAVYQQNKQAFDKVFGAEHAKYMEALIEASQRLKDNPFNARVNIGTISKTKAEEILGTKAETSLGELRNQVISAPRVFINHISRYFQNTASKKESAEIQKFLLDPKALGETAQLVSEIETRGVTDRAISLMGKIARSTGGSFLFGGAIGAGIGAQTENTPLEMNPELIRGFKGNDQ